MSYSWKRVGSFRTVVDAEEWCDRSGVDFRDRQIRPDGDNVELLVRDGAAASNNEPPTGGWW